MLAVRCHLLFACAALQVIIDGIQRIVEGLTEGVKPLKIDPLVLGIIGASCMHFESS